jgi:hypothetical protein
VNAQCKSGKTSISLRDIVGGLRKRNESRAFIRFANISSTSPSTRDNLPEMVIRTESWATIAGIGPDWGMKAGIHWHWRNIDQAGRLEAIEDSDEIRCSSRDNSQYPLNVSSLHFIGRVIAYLSWNAGLRALRELLSWNRLCGLVVSVRCRRMLFGLCARR